MDGESPGSAEGEVSKGAMETVEEANEVCEVGQTSADKCSLANAWRRTDSSAGNGEVEGAVFCSTRGSCDESRDGDSESRVLGGDSAGLMRRGVATVCGLGPAHMSTPEREAGPSRNGEVVRSVDTPTTAQGEASYQTEGDRVEGEGELSERKDKPCRVSETKRCSRMALRWKTLPKSYPRKQSELEAGAVTGVHAEAGSQMAGGSKRPEKLKESPEKVFKNKGKVPEEDNAKGKGKTLIEFGGKMGAHSPREPPAEKESELVEVLRAGT